MAGKATARTEAAGEQRVGQADPLDAEQCSDGVGASSDSAAPVEEEEFDSVCGRVSADPPRPGGSDPYWRLSYYEHGRRRQPSGGRTRNSAEAKMDSRPGPARRGPG